MKSLHLLSLVSLLLISISTMAETRRSYIILHDNSGSYYTKYNGNAIASLENSLISLFAKDSLGDKFPHTRLEKEVNQGIHFFEPSMDDIFFFWFVADQKGNLHYLQETDTLGNYRDFENYFFKEAMYPSFRKSRLTAENYLKENFEKRADNDTIPGCKLGPYTFSLFSYPLCLDIINTDYSQEYVVIIISDFRAGSTFGNKADEELVKKAFKTRSQNILNRVGWLRELFFLVDYGESYVSVDNKTMIGFTAFKIKPGAGYPKPENMDVRINSDIHFRQNAYGEDVYTMDSTNIEFKHSENLRTDKIAVQVTLPSSDTVCREISNVTPSADGVYSVPIIPDFKLDGILDEKSCFDCSVRYVFYTSYSLSKDSSDNNHSIKYIFDTSRSIARQNFDLQNKITKMEISVFSLLVLVLFLITLYFFFRGRPIGIKSLYNPVTDTFETVDFSKSGSGKLHTHYIHMGPKDNNRKEIKVEGCLVYHKSGRFYNWMENTGYPVYITLDTAETSSEFEIYVCDSHGRISNSDIPVKLEDVYVNKRFKFSILILRNAVSQMVNPVHITVKVKMHCVNSGLRKIDLSNTFEYDFHIGPDLGNVWVGLDPGTTGSCVAVATNINNLVIEKDSEGKDKIFPSVIHIKPFSFKGNENENDIKALIRENTSFGDKAKAVESQQNKFVSIKKLLGYTQSCKIETKEPKPYNIVEIDSSFLSTLIIEGLLKQQKSFIEEHKSNYPNFISDNSFAPQRAVIAIPNNFTAAKIQQLKKCIMNVKDLSIKEIRFIYEAEAILVNYINSDRCSQSKVELQESNSGENIFIFDMGGATINVTIARIRKGCENGNIKYDIEVICKLGYAIGGDTIDYAFLQWIYEKKDSFPDLSKTYPFTDNDDEKLSSKVSDDEKLRLMAERRELKDAVLKLKMSTISNYQKHKKVLLERTDIEKFNGFALSCHDIDSDPFIPDCRNNENSFLHNAYFEKFVWNNVDSIVKDVIKLCSLKQISTIDTVLLAGRSSHFPLVKEIVEKSIHRKFHPEIIHLDLEESKSAVAKGACYYGTMNGAIELHNRTITGSYGVLQTHILHSQPDFIKLINDGASFDYSNSADNQSNDKSGVVYGKAEIVSDSDFTLDGNDVMFCQVQGVDPESVVREGQKHKYSIIAKIHPEHGVKTVHTSVTDKDQVECWVTDIYGDNIPHEPGSVCDLDITKCNDKQYTFFIKYS